MNESVVLLCRARRLGGIQLVVSCLKEFSADRTARYTADTFKRPNEILRAQLMIVVEALDKLFSMNVLLILRTSIPKMDVSVDDEDLFS
jgi:hypothetical protein